MKFSVLSVLGALAVVASGALSAQATEDSTLWVGIIGYNDKGKFVDYILSLMSRDPDEPLPPAPTIPDEAQQFIDKCIKPYGEFSIMAATNLQTLNKDELEKMVSKSDMKSLTKAVTKAIEEGFGGADIFKNVDVLKIYRSILNKIVGSLKIEAKFFFLAPPSIAEDPACSPENLTKLIAFNSPSLAITPKLIKFESVALSPVALESCVEANSAGVKKPICQDNADTSACVACSSNNNGMVASAIGAAAMVALALFF